MESSRFARPLGATLVALLLSIALARVASAHAGIVSCQPAIGGTVQTAPAELRCTFSENLAPNGALITVTNRETARVDRNDPRVDASDPKLVTISLDPAKLPNGIYRVEWAVVSSIDGGITHDAFYFGVGVVVPPTPAPVAASVPSTPASPPLPSPILLAAVGAAVLVLIVAGVLFYRTWREPQS